MRCRKVLAAPAELPSMAITQMLVPSSGMLGALPQRAGLSALRFLCVLGLAACPLGCLSPGPFVIWEMNGIAVDKETGEPIPGVDIKLMHFSTYAERPALYHEDQTKTGADGRFLLPTHVTPSLRMWLFATQEAKPTASHPVHSVQSRRQDPESGEWRFELSLMTGGMPSSRSYPNGQPRYDGELIASGKRSGDWVFFREDGTEMARGQFYGGHAVGRWEWFDREGNMIEVLDCRFVKDPRIQAVMMSTSGSTFHLSPPSPSPQPCRQGETGAE